MARTGSLNAAIAQDVSLRNNLVYMLQNGRPLEKVLATLCEHLGCDKPKVSKAAKPTRG